MDQDEILVSAGGRPGHFPEHSNEANPAGRGPSLAKISLRPSRGSSQGLVGAIPSCGLAGCVPLAHLEDVRSVEGCCPLVAVRLDFFASVLDGLSGHHCCFVQGTSVAAPIYIVVQHQRSGCPGRSFRELGVLYLGQFGGLIIRILLLGYYIRVPHFGNSQVTCHVGPFLMAAYLPVMFLGALCAAYSPQGCSTQCFLDVVCIHQVGGRQY